MLVYTIRTIILYIFIMFGIRFMGKRQIGQLQPNELAITILMSNMATLPIENVDMPLFFGVIPICCLICLEFMVSFLGLKSKRLRSIITGRPIIIIENGKINQKAMKSLRFTNDDLMESLRGCSVFDLNSVAYAIVETNGTMSVVKKFESQNLTPKMIKLAGDKATIHLIIISDGVILYANLKRLNLSEQWLQTTIADKNLKLDQIFLMTADENKTTFIAVKEIK